MADARNQLQSFEIENERLTATMKEMVDSYTQQLHIRDETIRRLESTDAVHQGEMGLLVARENEALKNENRMMRDKVAILEGEVNHMNATRPQEHEFAAIRAELENEKRVRFEQQSYENSELAK